MGLLHKLQKKTQKMATTETQTSTISFKTMFEKKKILFYPFIRALYKACILLDMPTIKLTLYIAFIYLLEWM